MKFKLHDQVVHWNYGLGEIVGIEETSLSGEICQYYVLAADRLTLWVPVNERGENSMRLPASPQEFSEYLQLLQGQAKTLPVQQYIRQNELSERMKYQSLAEVVCIVRDLVHYARTHKLNYKDQEILKRAKSLLIDEWQLSLKGTREHAEIELSRLLSGSTVNA